MDRLSVTFKDKDIAYKRESYRFELDRYKNAGKTEFGINDKCYLKLFPSGIDTKLNITSGTAKIVGRGIPEDVEEYLIFQRSKDADFFYPADKINSYEWIGRDCGNVTFDRYSAHLAEPKSGVLRVDYTTYYDSVEVTSNKEGKILIEGISDDGYGSIVVDFKTKTRNVYLTVKDACSKSVVANSKVYLNEKYVGNTDTYGRIYLGELATGTYKLKVSKTGYQDTDKDAIANDEFVVSE